jgi:hypothetical protein
MVNGYLTEFSTFKSLYARCRVISYPTCWRFDFGGSLNRRVNCCCVSQSRCVGARRNTRGTKEREPRLVLSCAQGGCACSRGYKRSRGRVRDCPSARSPAWPPPRTRALDLPFIDVRRRPRCTMGGVAMC